MFQILQLHQKGHHKEILLNYFEQDLYPGANELSFEDRDKFVEAYNIVGKAVESGQLPESVEDAVFDMLGKLGINL